MFLNFIFIPNTKQNKAADAMRLRRTVTDELQREGFFFRSKLDAHVCAMSLAVVFGRCSFRESSPSRSSQVLTRPWGVSADEDRGERRERAERSGVVTPQGAEREQQAGEGLYARPFNRRGSPFNPWCSPPP
jgi:hypothetical protein